MVAVTLRGPFQQWDLERQGLLDTIRQLENSVRELRETTCTQKNQLSEYQKLLAQREAVIVSEMNKSRGLEAKLVQQAKETAEAQRLANTEWESAREAVEEMRKVAARAEAAAEEAKCLADAAMAERDAAFYDISSTEKETRVLVMRLDKAEACVERLTEENGRLRGDLEAMTRSRDNHSRHNCVLLKEKARQGDLIASLKRELARPEMRIAAARAARGYHNPPLTALSPPGRSAASSQAAADYAENMTSVGQLEPGTHGHDADGDVADSWCGTSSESCRRALADLSMNGSTSRSSKHQQALDALTKQLATTQAQVGALKRENAQLVVRFRGANEDRAGRHAPRAAADRDRRRCRVILRRFEMQQGDMHLRPALLSTSRGSNSWSAARTCMDSAMQVRHCMQPRSWRLPQACPIHGTRLAPLSPVHGPHLQRHHSPISSVPLEIAACKKLEHLLSGRALLDDLTLQPTVSSCNAARPVARLHPPQDQTREAQSVLAGRGPLCDNKKL
eukprot:jgi/Mesvir1/23203/Mv22667-RA.1